MWTGGRLAKWQEDQSINLVFNDSRSKSNINVKASKSTVFRDNVHI